MLDRVVPSRDRAAASGSDLAIALAEAVPIEACRLALPE